MINLPICAEDLGHAEKLSALHFEQIFVLSVCNAELIHSFSLLSMSTGLPDTTLPSSRARGASKEGVARAQTECVVMMNGFVLLLSVFRADRGGTRKYNGRH